MRRRTLIAGLLGAVVALGAPVPSGHAQEELGERVVRLALVKAAGQLAGAGRGAPAHELLDVAAALGHPEKDLARALAAVDKKLSKAKRGGSTAAATKTLRKALDGLADAVAGAEGERREALARITLRLDAEHAAAHEALGHVRRPEGWAEPELVPLLDRRAATRLAIEEARRLEVPVAFSAGGSAILAKITGGAVRRATWGRVHVQSTHLDDHKLARVLRSAVRAAAVSNFVLHGELRLPEPGRDCSVSIFPAKPAFQDGLREAVALGRLAGAEGAVALRSESWLVNGGERLMAPLTEAGMETWLLCDVIRECWYSESSSRPQPSLEVGHQNWVARTFLGAGVTYAGLQTRGERPGGSTSDDGGRARAPEEMWRLANAGIAGSRSWMRYLVEKGEDPAWSASFSDQHARIQGDDLLKATFVAEYLQEADRLLDVLKKTAGKPPEAATFEAGIGESLALLEERWRRWMTFPASAGGVLQQVGDAGEDEDPADREVLEHLDRLRSLGIDESGRLLLLPLTMDGELSDGCRAHANYLLANPEQLAAWPDAHEEWPDRERFSAEGSWSGQHSVIVGGVTDGRAAIDSWMGTFYHRVPLLDPGLVRVGYGFEAGVAVLDTNSMTGPFGWRAWVGWPAPGSSGVPRTFNPELPNPVPGADQSVWGYPVTLQLFARGPDADLTIALFEGGSAAGEPVDCHLSTPSRPTNPELAPADAWCLIPKAHLKPRTTYTVVAQGVPLEGRETLQWSFTTGAADKATRR